MLLQPRDNEVCRHLQPHTWRSGRREDEALKASGPSRQPRRDTLPGDMRREARERELHRQPRVGGRCQRLVVIPLCQVQVL